MGARGRGIYRTTSGSCGAANSGLGDGWEVSADLTGGYYDAGDNVKFGFPMAFTATMLAWSVIEFGDSMPAGELRNALVAIRWATDYLLKTVSQLPNRIFVQVGDPIKDHSCWERPEDMDTARTVYTVEAPNTASDVAGETAAALAASSIAFRSSDPAYSETLLRTAVKAFEFADTYRGAYSDNSDIRDGDELLWGAAWLRRASQDDSYLNYIQNNGKTLGADDNINEFGWDNKHAGLNVLVSKEVLEGNMYSLQSYKASADSFMCTLTPDSDSSHIEYTPGGLIYTGQVAATSSTPQSSRSSYSSTPTTYSAPHSPNYYPQRIHHRGSSLPSIKDHPQMIGCKEGSVYFNSSDPNPNVLVGAIVGGPGEDDAYDDNREDFRKSEPTTYINAPFVGVLAYFVANPNPS
ncbi:glycosyl hydrolase 9B18 [Actinidia rufa]|uniref:Endoglucanase n=1 Tax=Actinidia rufa TaxID=165716 RepID=A0A7J0F952_9ERIC|nr:glycosyl hydrolase 9B18 [Actinidia rufa]